MMHGRRPTGTRNSGNGCLSRNALSLRVADHMPIAKRSKAELRISLIWQQLHCPQRSPRPDHAAGVSPWQSRRAGRRHVASCDYAGEHWLATFCGVSAFGLTLRNNLDNLTFPDMLSGRMAPY